MVSRDERRFLGLSKVRRSLHSGSGFLISEMSDYLQGDLKIDEYVTHSRKFDELNAGFHDMHVSICKPRLCLSLTIFQAGNCIRCVVDMS